MIGCTIASRSRPLLLLFLAAVLLLPAGRAEARQARHRYGVSLGPSLGRVLPWGHTTFGGSLELSGGTKTEIALRLDLHPLVSGQPGHLLGGVQGVVRRFLRRWRKGQQPALDPFLGLGAGTFFGSACTTEHACGGLSPRLDLEAGLRLNLAEHWDLQGSARLGLQGPSSQGFEHAISPTFAIALRWRSGLRENRAR